MCVRQTLTTELSWARYIDKIYHLLFRILEKSFYPDTLVNSFKLTLTHLQSAETVDTTILI